MSSVASCHLRLPEPGLRLSPVDSALSRYNVKPGTSTTVVVATLFVVFGVELASHSVSNETLLLKFGALPDDGELHGEYWRLATYSFLHLNGTHLLVNYLCFAPTTFCTNASKRGSPRSGSSGGSTLIIMTLRLSSSAIACSKQRIALSRFPRLR